jgi:flagellin-like hook-associated protein FlgL
MTVSLSKSVRQSLLTLQSTADMMSQTQNRLATGKKVNSALDNATNYFTSAGLNGRATDLTNLLDGISNSVKTLEAANNGISAITKLVETAQSTARQALAAGTDAATRTKLTTQYVELMSQIDKMANDASFNGVNLIKDAATTMKVVFNEKTGAAKNELDVDSVNLTSTGLALTTATLATDTDAETALTELNTALTSLRSAASTFGASMTIIQTRQDFTKSTISTLKTGADNLVLADTNEEAATLLALQTRQQLASTALSMSNQQDQSVLRLFG